MSEYLLGKTNGDKAGPQAPNWPARKLSSSAVTFIYSFVPAITVILYALLNKAIPTAGNLMALAVISAVASFGLCSLYRSPQQFFLAVAERIICQLAIVIFLCLRILIVLQTTLNFLLRLSLRGVRFLIGVSIAILYFIFPIDLFPDIIPVIGWLDDIGVAVVSIRWGLFVSKFAINLKLREWAEKFEPATRGVSTPFP